MNAPRLANADDNYWSHPAYKVRVRNTMYLWGSAGITQDLTFYRPLLLHVHNHLFGEVIAIGTRVASGTETTLGTLQPGETVTIAVQGLSGVFASCTLESTVSCLIKDSP
jgi:hypothetical protein